MATSNAKRFFYVCNDTHTFYRISFYKLGYSFLSTVPTYFGVNECAVSGHFSRRDCCLKETMEIPADTIMSSQQIVVDQHNMFSGFLSHSKGLITDYIRPDGAFLNLLMTIEPISMQENHIL